MEHLLCVGSVLGNEETAVGTKPNQITAPVEEGKTSNEQDK